MFVKTSHPLFPSLSLIAGKFTPPPLPRGLPPPSPNFAISLTLSVSLSFSLSLYALARGWATGGGLRVVGRFTLQGRAHSCRQNEKADRRTREFCECYSPDHWALIRCCPPFFCFSFFPPLGRIFLFFPRTPAAGDSLPLGLWERQRRSGADVGQTGSSSPRNPRGIPTSAASSRWKRRCQSECRRAAVPDTLRRQHFLNLFITVSGGIPLLFRV